MRKQSFQKNSACLCWKAKENKNLTNRNIELKSFEESHIKIAEKIEAS